MKLPRNLISFLLMYSSLSLILCCRQLFYLMMSSVEIMKVFHYDAYCLLLILFRFIRL